jgi:hypothetical protein
VVAQALRHQGFQVYCVGVKDHADPGLRDLCHGFRWGGVASIGAQIRYFKRHRVRQAVMAGKVFKNWILYRGLNWLRHLPDWRGLCTFYPHFFSRTKDRKDDTLLMAIVDACARDGIQFVPATDFAPELLVKHGTLSRRPASDAERQDIAFGWRLAKELGRLDIGQTVVVKGRAVIALEAIEGTDQCIRRAGSLCPPGGFTVVKVAKPQQDMRFDVPTVGLSTLETLIEAGGRVLAVEAGKTIILDELEVIEFANRHRLTLIAINAAEIGQLSEAA